MKLHVLLAAVTALLSASLPRRDCKAIETNADDSPTPDLRRADLPILMRAGEEQISLRLDSPRLSSLKGALQLQLKRGRARRSDDAPISLDLTFHLLREVLQMARAEQLAQQASSNRRMMEIFGK